MPDQKEETIQEISAWTRFKNSVRWRLLTQRLERVIEVCDNEIEQVGADSELKYSRRDIMIIRKKLAKELITYPDFLISLLNGTFSTHKENEDAYMSMYGDEDDDPGSADE